MKMIKRVLGFDSPYSWMKYLRIAVLSFVLFTALLSTILDWHFVELIFFIIIFGPVLFGVTVLIAVLTGGIRSGKRQARSLKESEASGSVEILELDKIRIKVQSLRFFIGMAIAVVVISGTMVSCSAGVSIDGEPLELSIGVYAALIGGIVLLLILLGKYYQLKILYNESFKKEIVEKELNSFLINMEFAPHQALDQSVVKDSHLFTHFDLYSGNDLLTAEYKNRRFTQSDICLHKALKDDDGSSTYSKIFMGRFMIFDYDAISNEPVFVRDNRMADKTGNDIKTELDTFNKIFSIDAADATTAFRILTPQVQEGIVLASEKLNCPMSLAFLNDKIYVAIANGDSFEATSKGDATLTEQRERIKVEIQAVADMVETLYLK